MLSDFPKKILLDLYSFSDHVPSLLKNLISYISPDTRLMKYQDFLLLLKNHIFITCSILTCEDIGVAMVANFLEHYCLYFSFITLYPSFITFL